MWTASTVYAKIGTDPITRRSKAMAAKKKEEKKVQATESEVKPVRLDLSPEVHKLLRLVAADEGVSMAAFARDNIEVLLRAEAKRRGIKS